MFPSLEQRKVDLMIEVRLPVSGLKKKSTERRISPTFSASTKREKRIVRKKTLT
jgi:hypothetical protein